MFLHLCAILFTGGSLSRGLCPDRSLSRGFSIQGGLFSRGVSVWGSVSRGPLSVQGICLCPGGLCPGGSVSRGYLCPWGVSLSRVVSLRGEGGLCQGDPHTVMCGRYASYWNAFLYENATEINCGTGLTSFRKSRKFLLPSLLDLTVGLFLFPGKGSSKHIY